MILTPHRHSTTIKLPRGFIRQSPCRTSSRAWPQLGFNDRNGRAQLPFLVAEWGRPTISLVRFGRVGGFYVGYVPDEHVSANE
jgi:hypothetical protein